MSKRMRSKIMKEILRPKRKYIAVYVDEETNSKLVKYCMENGIDLSVEYSGDPIKPEEFKFHITIIYSTSYHDDIDLTQMEGPIGPFTMTPTGFEFYGEENNILVIEFERGYAHVLREWFDEKFNMKDEWPVYKPHLSMSYSGSNNIPQKLPDFPLVFDKIKIKNIEED